MKKPGSGYEQLKGACAQRWSISAVPGKIRLAANVFTYRLGLNGATRCLPCSKQDSIPESKPSPLLRDWASQSTAEKQVLQNTAGHATGLALYEDQLDGEAALTVSGSASKA